MDGTWTPLRRVDHLGRFESTYVYFGDKLRVFLLYDTPFELRIIAAKH